MAELLTQERNTESGERPVEALVAFLRAHPYKLDYSRQELAEKFGLEEEFVSDVLDTLRGSPNRLNASESLQKALVTSVRTTVTYLGKLYEDLTDRPVVSVIVTLLTTVAVMLLLRYGAAEGWLPVAREQVQSTLQSAMLFLGGTLLLLHGLVYFRHGMMRYAFIGSLIVTAVTVTLVLQLGAGRPIQVSINQAVQGAQTTPLLIVAGVIMGFVYFMYAMVVSLAGGYWHTSQADKQQRRQTRQELIDRLFQLQAAVRSSSFSTQAQGRLGLVASLRVTPWMPLIGLVAGFALGVVTVSLRSAYGGPPEDLMGMPDLPMGVDAIVQVVTGVAFLVVGYLAAGVRRAIVALVLMFAGTLMAESLPFRFFGPDYIESLRLNGELLDGLRNTLVFSLLIGMGGHIERRARVRRKLQENDPAHLTAEMVEIQWRLSPTAGSSSTMVVDVAGSTRMKAEADPLAVEYSFRAYHQFVSEIAQRRGGTMVATAGDGAVATFPSCGEALYAAKEIQTRIGEFNAKANRLPSQFRVRIGIHTGRVSARLQEVPFNELIDIAAHIEKEAPVGGIAVTQSVVEDLEDERVAALKDPIDGHNVFVILNPTLVQ